MHELSIACNLVEIADEAARAAHARRVTIVRLQLGALAGVVEDALRFSFPVAATGTLVEGATLAIEQMPVEIFCEQCAVPRTLSAPYVFRCPVCASPVSRLLQGRQIQIDTIEIEETEVETTHP